FYKIVDTQNVCELDYQFWRHNEWIRLPEEGAEIAGYPRPNHLYGPKVYKDHALIHSTPGADRLSVTQKMFKTAEPMLVWIYRVLWLLSLGGISLIVSKRKNWIL